MTKNIDFQPKYDYIPINPGCGTEFTRGEVERPEAPLLPHFWRSGSASQAFPAEFAGSVKSVSQTLWRLPALHFLLEDAKKRRTRRH
jgi:hypothetical protein